MAAEEAKPFRRPKWCTAPRSPERHKQVVRAMGNHEAGPSSWDLLDKAVYTIGRNDTADFQVKGELVSRVHAAVLQDVNGQRFLVDLKSTQGTFLDSKRLKPHEPVPWPEGKLASFGFGPKAVFMVLGSVEAEGSQPPPKKQRTAENSGEEPDVKVEAPPSGDPMAALYGDLPEAAVVEAPKVVEVKHQPLPPPAKDPTKVIFLDIAALQTWVSRDLRLVQVLSRIREWNADFITGIHLYGKTGAIGNSTSAFAVQLETTSTLMTTVAPSVLTTLTSRPTSTTSVLPVVKTTTTTAKKAPPKSGSLCTANRECGNWVRMTAPRTQTQPIGGHPAFRNKHIVMIGDSRMRYQYMSLAYFFTAGAWATGDDLYLLISAEKCGKNWHTWFNLTNHLLKYELCNCYRPQGGMQDTVEHRYYRNPNNMVAITYLQKFGEAFLPLRGHWHVNGTNIDLCNCQCGPNRCHPAIETPKWSAKDMVELGQVVSNLRPDYVVFHPGWEEIVGWKTEEVAKFFSLVQESNPSAQLYFKTRLLRSNDQHEPFLAWANKYYKDLYKNLKFAEHGWHMWDVSNMTASWKANDSKATFMWDQYHYDLRSNNALNRNMLKTLFGVDVRKLT
ncbi:Ppp1r8 [Symbiodinium sp. CCMP2592]|nr:Ppp1r8 [Symbiodinium sp. CCMP2592]